MLGLMLIFWAEHTQTPEENLSAPRLQPDNNPKSKIPAGNLAFCSASLPLARSWQPATHVATPQEACPRISLDPRARGGDLTLMISAEKSLMQPVRSAVNC